MSRDDPTERSTIPAPPMRPPAFDEAPEWAKILYDVGVTCTDETSKCHAEAQMIRAELKQMNRRVEDVEERVEELEEMAHDHPSNGSEQ